jgi:hypothetical protein
MKGLKGGKVNVTESLNMASTMPVYVTNWGGAGLGAGNGNLLTGTGAGGVPVSSGGLVDQYGRPIASQPASKSGGNPVVPLSKPKGGSNWQGRAGGAAKGAGAAAAVTAIVSAVGLGVELTEIEKNGELSKEEKAGARGGAVGGQRAV